MYNVIWIHDTAATMRCDAKEAKVGGETFSFGEKICLHEIDTRCELLRSTQKSQVEIWCFLCGKYTEFT